MSYRLLIDGRLETREDRLAVVNPANGKVFEHAPRSSESDAREAIAAARRAFPAWAALSYAERSTFVARLAQAIAARTDAFAELLTREQGKPIAQARGEIKRSVEALTFYSTQEISDRILRRTETDYIVEQHYPRGVCVAITPWNYPMVLLAHKIGPALMTGNPAIAKPAPTTPLTTLLLGEVASEIFPKGVFQTVVDDNDLGPLLTSHPDVAVVSFTGSTATGKKVLASTTATLKHAVLELGGNDAAIVLDDADVGGIARALFMSATFCSGQICMASKRIYLPKAMEKPMCEALAALAGQAVVGDGLDENVTIGPIQNERQFNKLLDYLDEARRLGRVIAGGSALDRPGYFIPPTIVCDMPDDSRLVREEQFGPILPILTYTDTDEVVRRANDTAYGLTGTVWTSDVERGLALASRVESGTIWVNRFMDLPNDIAVGGAKQSGTGMQFGQAGMKEFTQRRLVNAALPPRAATAS